MFSKKCFKETHGKNFWEKVAYFGVKDDMPVYLQKSTIFYNIALRISALSMLVIGLFLFISAKQTLVPVSFVIAILFIGFSLLLNMNGKVCISVFITSIFFPVYFLTVSVFAKLNGEGNSLMFFIMPRFGIIAMTVISFAVLGFNNTRRAVIGASVGLLTFILFNHVHEYFGIHLQNLKVDANIGNFIIFALSGIFIFILMVVSILQKINNEYEAIVTQQKNELADKNTEIIAQNEEIIVQSEYIEKQNEQIQESIRYAARIQEAVLESSAKAELEPQLFVMFKPRDIVSGDFYKVSKLSEHEYLFIAADCTGHGVPGAFVSMLGISFLGEIIRTTNQPADILNRLREKIKASLHQTGKSQEAKDGMDMAVCLINTQTKELKFAGAHNPLVIVHINSEITQLKADRMPVGVHLKEKPFTQKEYKIQPGDSLYMFSDGFIDQFGGEKGDKYKQKRFKDLLKKIHKKELSTQKNELENEFETWSEGYSQLDDILVMGIKCSE